MDLSAALTSLLDAKSVETLFSAYEKALKSVGYDRVLFALLTDHPQLGLSATHGVLKNYPDDWVAHYLEQGYAHIDPVRRLAAQQHLPFRWESITDHLPLSPLQQKMFAEAEEAQLHQGLGIPLSGLGMAKAGVGLARSVRGAPLDVQTLMNIQVLSMQFYACYWGFYDHDRAPVTDASRRLSVRELDILHWLALGSTKAEIADKLFISCHTVDYHVRHILHKLNARNITSAVYFAVSRGLLIPG